MSEVVPEAPALFEQYSRGLATIADADDFVSAWHDSGDEEQRSLAEYLGLTDETYGVWFIAPRALPAILAARRAGGPLRAFVEPFYQQLRAAGDPADRPAVFTLAHWLGRLEEAATVPAWSAEARAASAG